MMTNNSCLFIILVTALKLSLVYGQVFYGSTGTTACSSGLTSCTLICDADHICGSGSSTPESQGQLYCPSGTSCQECNVICEGDNACRAAVIYGQSCAQLNVILKSGATVGRYLTVNAPSDGSLYVNLTELVSNDPFRDGRVYAASTTDEIIVDCNEGAASNDHCKNMIVDGKDANYVEINCNANADCTTPSIYCPTASTLDPQVTKSCKLNCDSSQICTGSIYVASNAWGTDLEIPNYQCTTCATKVYCGSSTSNFCTIDSSTTCGGASGGAGCPNPTAYPTPLPTDQPSDEPTNNPTDKPTPIPTLRPTDIPSTNPTDKPTAQPTSDPFVVPTFVPTDRPSDVPTRDPTDKPTNAPSSDPTNRPTDHPSSDPTDKPTNEPTNDPSDYPTADPTNKPSAQPTDGPTPVPTDKPSDDPTPMPTDRPTTPPTGEPTGAPTTPNPTRVPSNIPSDVPTLTFPPTFMPTNPTASPSVAPVKNPTSQPVNYTTAEPSLAPSNPPTEDSEGFGAGTTQTGTSDSTGLIIGIVISVAAVMAAGIGFFMYMRKQKETDKKNALALQKAIKDKGELTTGKRGELHNTDGFAPIQSTSHVLMVTPHGGTTPGGPDIVVPQTPTSPQEGFHVAMPDFTGSNRNAATRQSTVAVTPGNDGNRNSNINMTNSYKAKTGNVFLSTNDGDEDDDGEFNDEEKEIEFVTPGGGPAMGFDVTENDDENEDNNSDTSQSSQEELDAIRSQIVAQSIASGVTPGGPGGGASGPNGFNPNAWNPTTDPNGETQKQQRQKYEQARRDSAEMGIEIAKLMDEVDNQKKEAKAKINAKDDKFGAMLNDNLMATDLIETDIVNEMNDDLMNPNKANETPAGDNGGLDENGYGLTPGGDDNDNSISNNGGEGGESYQ